MNGDEPPVTRPSIDLPLFSLRALFFTSAMGLGLYIARDLETPELQFVAMIVAGMIASCVIIVDGLTIARSSIATVSAIVFGLLTGFLAAQLFIGIVSLMGDFEGPDGKVMLNGIRLALTLIFCYLGPAYILRTKDDLRFIVPYVEFRRVSKGLRPLVLDTSALIDGRVVDLARMGLFEAPMLVPRFVVDELQQLADLKDKSRRQRARRGLDRLKDLQSLPGIEVSLLKVVLGHEEEVDRRLIDVARAREGKVVTVDYNLQKVCEVEDCPVLNPNELAEALRPQHLPGESLQLTIVKPGESQGQGVGYLEDGTMVVVEGGRAHKSKRIRAQVTSAIQSSQGRMVFAKFAEVVQDPSQPSAPDEDG